MQIFDNAQAVQRKNGFMLKGIALTVLLISLLASRQVAFALFMQNAAGMQALIANAVKFSGSGSSALVAISKGNAPLKTILAFNDGSSPGRISKACAI